MSRRSPRRTSSPQCRLAAERGQSRLGGALSFAERLFIEPAKTEIFNLEKFFDPVMGALAAQSRLLDATKGCDLVRDQPRIDPNHSRVQRLGRPPDPADVAAEEVTCQPELCIVGHLKTFLVGFKPEERSQGTKGLLLGDLHLRSHARKYGRFKKCLAESMALAAQENVAALRDGILDMFLHLFNRGLINQWALLNSGFKPVADLELRDSCDQFFRKGIIHARLDI